MNNDFHWIRLLSPIHIPKYLVEQINGREYETIDFYTYLHDHLMISNENGLCLNPFCYLYLIQDKDLNPCGFLWYTLDTLTKTIFLQEFSMDAKYWNKGQACEMMMDHLHTFNENKKYKICWLTDRLSPARKAGFKPTKQILMQYMEKDHGEHPESSIRGKAEEPISTECESSHT